MLKLSLSKTCHCKDDGVLITYICIHVHVVDGVHSGGGWSSQM